MKVSELSKEQLELELKKTIKVRAIGDRDIHVGYYNHLRRRGGDVFILRPVIRKRVIKVLDPIAKREVASKKSEDILITAEMQFSERWMTKVGVAAAETSPAHFNEVGRGRNRPKLDIPGMTSKAGGDDEAAMRTHNAGGAAGNASEDTTTQNALENASGKSDEDVI